MKHFTSIAESRGTIRLPKPIGTRVIMMPFFIHDLSTIPVNLTKYLPTIVAMLKLAPNHIEAYKDTPAYLTIDERFVQAGTIQRNPGLHVDGMYQGTFAGPWSHTDPGSWGSVGNGMLIVSNVSQSVAVYTGDFSGSPINDGDCEHLRGQLVGKKMILPKAGEVIWADGLNVHESLPMIASGVRQFIRISMPNDGVWFEDYTHNPLGVKPKGKILPARLPSQRKLYGKEQ